MKTFSVLFCLLAGSVAACASITNPLNPGQDRPMRLYVASYDQDLVQDSYSQDYNVNGNGDPTGDDYGTIWSWYHTITESSLAWFDGFGGNGEQIEHITSDSAPWGGGSGTNYGNIVWPASSWPNVTPGWITYTPVSDNDGPFPSPVIWEHCDIGVPVVDASGSWTNTVWDYQTWYDQELWKFKGARHAQAVLKLQTGGKALSQRQNLIAFHGTATRIFPIKAPAPTDPNTIPRPDGTVAPQNITVDGKALGGDGNLYEMIPDNDERIVTPTVAGADYYTFGLTTNKYTPVIAARGNGNNYDDLSVTNPEFCVGQQLTFWLNWNPPTTNIDSIRWHLPDKYVNQPTNYSATCMTYIRNDDLLTNATTQCWYVRDPGGDCSVRETLRFPNGQSVNIAAKGSFTIYRPNVQFTTNPPFFVVLTNGFMSLGDTWDNQGRMSFDAKVTSTNFSGNANFVQLINRSVIGDWPAYVRLNTFGSYWRDNDPFYNTITDENGNSIGTPPDHTAIGPGLIGDVGFSDNPGIGCYSILLGIVSITDGFKTHVVFQPSGDGSIWVTLGRVDWGWSGYAGVDINNGIVELESSSIIPPAYTDTDDFPVYSNVYR